MENFLRSKLEQTYADIVADLGDEYQDLDEDAVRQLFISTLSCLGTKLPDSFLKTAITIILEA